LLRLSVLAVATAIGISPCFAQGTKFPTPSNAESRALYEAREHELRGESGAAFEAYRSFLLSGREAVDVALHFAGIARARLGAEEARKILREIGAGNPAVGLAIAALADPLARRKTLEVFTTARPEFGPAYALLAAEYTQARAEDQSLHDRVREREVLSHFLAFDAQGKLSEYFVDAAVLAAWLERAERRLAALDVMLSGAAAAPTVKFTRSNSAWIAYLNIPERPTEISYRVGNGPAISTGIAGSIDMRTGRKMPNVHFMLPLDTPPTTIELMYRDITGRESGPHPIRFDPREIIFKADRETLAAEIPGWANFSDGQSHKEWLYFNTVMYSRCVIAKVEYGYDGPPTMEFPLPPCDLSNPNATPADAQSAVKMPPEARTVTVRLTFTDGTTGTRSYKRR